MAKWEKAVLSLILVWCTAGPSSVLVLEAAGFSYASSSASSSGNSDGPAKTAKPSQASSWWHQAIGPIIIPQDEDQQQRQQSRLRVFANAVWDNYCRQAPSHQHLLLRSSELEQKCDAPFPDLEPIQPLHDARDFPWCHELERNWKIVLQELQAYLSFLQQKEVDNNNNNKKHSSWKTSTTALCSDTSGFTKLTLQEDQGNPTRVGQTHFPRTLELLSSCVGQDNLAPRPININCQAPNTGLAPHSDNMNFLLTCHLGLIIPRGSTEAEEECCCTFYIGPYQYQWEPGRLVVADTSFVHSTQNTNTNPKARRYVLSFNIWHPNLTLAERQGIVRIHAILQQHMLQQQQRRQQLQEEDIQEDNTSSCSNE